LQPDKISIAQALIYFKVYQAECVAAVKAKSVRANFTGNASDDTSIA
jgi:hypothetical protein